MELTLPTIEKSKLKLEFLELLELSNNFNAKIIQDVKFSLKESRNLFDDYIGNLRDVKRLFNVFSYEYNLTEFDINITDLLNFIYLKMKFAFATKFLINYWSYIIDKNEDNSLILKMNKKEENNISLENIFADINYDDVLNLKFDDYIITKGLDKNPELGSSYSDKMQNHLFAKSLIVLFGEENKINGYNSIRYSNNLRKLLQQSLRKDDLEDDSFNELISGDFKSENIKQYVIKGVDNEIIQRLDFIILESIDKIINVLLVLFYIYEHSYNKNRDKIFLIESTLYKLNSKINFKIGRSDCDYIWKKLQNHYLNNDAYRIKPRIDLLSLLLTNKSNLLIIKEIKVDSLKKLICQLFENYLQDNDNNLWNLEDFTFYSIYHNLKNIIDKEYLNNKIINFWKRNDIRLLAAQTLDSEVSSISMVRTNDVIIEIFSKKEDYKKFIENNSIKENKPELQEYLEFLKLESYTGYKQYVRFDFDKFDLCKQRLLILKNLKNIDKDQFAGITEFIFETSNKDIADISILNLNTNRIKGYHSHIRLFNKMFYTFIRVENSYRYNAKSNIFKHYKNSLIDQRYLNVEITQDEIKVDNIVKIKLVSVQP